MALFGDTPAVGRRIGAFALDFILISGYLIVLAVVGSFLTFGPTGAEWRRLLSSPLRLDLVAFCTAVLPVLAYFTLLEGSARGATWGKRRMGLRVVHLSGRSLGRVRAFLRSVVKFLPWQLAHTCLLHIPGWPEDPQQPPSWVIAGMVLVWVLVGAYVLTLVVRADRRTLYDLVAASRVVGTEQMAQDNSH